MDASTVEAWKESAHQMLGLGRIEEAAECYRRVLAVSPDDAVALNNLAGLCMQRGRPDEASRLLVRLLGAHGRFAEAVANLGSAHLVCGRVDQAIECFREALSTRPDYAQAHSNLLLAMLYSDAQEPREVFDEHIKWASMHLRPRPGRPAHVNPPDPSRPLRIGYLSPDLHFHPVASFLEPILAQHDRERYPASCYHDSPQSDEVTARLRGFSSRWCETAQMDDEQLGSTIQADGIDILVELSVHSGGNRLAVAAAKPAPVVISYLGYAFTSGLREVDYRITDLTLDPPGMTEHLHTERLLRLPNTFWCFQPPAEAPDISRLPAASNGHITFGSANRLAKLTPTTIRWWSSVLRRVENSRLLLIAPELLEESVRQTTVEQFAACGVAVTRIQTQGAVPLKPYLSCISQFDIALDSYPFTGGATTCQTLWMGVPVVTIAGKTPLSRVSASVLTAIGMESLVAPSADDAVAVAVSLASDIARLAQTRAEFRGKMQKSALTDAPAFAGNLESAYRAVWRQWCGAARQGEAR
jgi:predicted O-linked N-acetylglucosamine transferase (SPINDLY family)